MTKENKDLLMKLLQQHKALGISDQIDFDKFYLYSIITHSTAIEGSTVTEVEAQLLFDEGITSSKRTMLEQQMNLDLKVAYDYGREWIRRHEPITTDWLILLASKVMARTGSEYHSIGGDFSAAKGELRKLNVTAGTGGKSYLAYQKVPARLAAFCEELNRRRKAIEPTDVAAVYDLSFWAHFELVTIHPWADGNGRTCRLLMNLLQWEFDVLPTKVLKEDKAEYIQALIDTRDLNCMARHHCQHLQTDIDQFIKSVASDMVDKQDLKQEMVDKWSIKPSLAEKLVDILEFLTDCSATKGDACQSKKDLITTEKIVSHFGFNPTTAKRYLRQLTEFGYLEAHGGNKNRTYSMKS